MTPKAQLIGNYDVPFNQEHHQQHECDKKKETNHQRSPSMGSNSSSDIIASLNNCNTNTNNNYNQHSSASLILNTLTNRVSNVISPATIFLVATPIAVQYPFLQLLMFLTILVGTSPLYFIMITFVGQSNKRNIPYSTSRNWPNVRIDHES